MAVSAPPDVAYLPVIRASGPDSRSPLEQQMTTLDTASHVSTAALRWGDALAAPMEGVVRRVLDWNDARVTRRMLSTLSARQLDDIGLCRGDIAEVAARSFR